MQKKIEDIKKHWGTAARRKGEASKVETRKGAFPLEYCGTHKDYNLQYLEINALLKYINQRDHIVDVGCGTGYATLYMAWKREISILGVDYSDEMIAVARKNLRIVESKLRGNVTFAVGDVMSLQLDEEFDTAITERCLNNIPSWRQQKKAIENISRIVRKGGLLLMLEGSKQGLKRLNQIRLQNGLNEIPIVWHNLFFDDRLLEAYASQLFEPMNVDNFCSTYMLISRVLHPALVFPEEPRYEAKINDLAANMPNFGDFGQEKLYVFRNR